MPDAPFHTHDAADALRPDEKPHPVRADDGEGGCGGDDRRGTAADRPHGPRMPDAVERHHDTSAGRMRSRSVGQPAVGVPEVVVVQGMAVADYLMPAVAELGGWTRAHLVELPGFAGSGEPTRALDVPGYAAAVGDWLDQAVRGPVVVVGHSSGTQVAARVAVQRADAGRVVGLVLASPTVAPIARPFPRLVLQWQRDGRHEPPGLTESHLREWRRAGLRGLVHLVRVHLRDRIEDAVAALRVPLLVLRGTEDRLTTASWSRGLAQRVPSGSYVELPGAHTFVWADPAAWSEPIRRFVLAVSSAEAGR
jgi:pimeloyl-ACP methyl ester carboxylesterase